MKPAVQQTHRVWNLTTWKLAQRDNLNPSVTFQKFRVIDAFLVRRSSLIFHKMWADEESGLVVSYCYEKCLIMINIWGFQWDKYQFLREARSILPRKGNKNFIIDAKDRKLFIRVINICPQHFELGKCCTEKTQEKPQKNQENVESTVNKNVKFHLRFTREKIWRK